MKISKHIFLEDYEVVEAIEEYLSRKNIAYKVKDLSVFADDDENFTGIEVTTE